ncbi:MAG: hypothetical protein HYX25_00320 [Candidatus Solibacter usitatus]|nr:hypothetical protein [Candidatus Solibacter usitatus]
MAAAAAAQHRGGGSFSTAPSARPVQASPRSNYGSLGGFGNVLYPGKGHAPGTYIPSNSGTIQQGRFRRPVTYPVIVGGYYPYGYGFGGYYDGGYGGYPYPGDPSAYAAQPAPQVIINQNFVPDRANPLVREYAPDTGMETIRTYDAPGRAPAASTEEPAAYYLLAFKDSSVYSAFAYWVEGDTLHYVTSDRIHNQASLNLVDRELTERLNRDRNMQVRLPR